MKAKLASLNESIRTGFWAVPMLCVLVSAALAFGLVAVDRAVARELPGVFGGGPDGAREVLSAITGSMITFTGLVFTITIVVLQLTSSQFSPRVLRTFLRDRQTQLSLGVFIATFVYSMLVLRTVDGENGEVFVPSVATTASVLLLLASVGMFVAYIHHISTAIQISSIIHSIAVESRGVLERELPTDLPHAPAVVRPRRTPVAVVASPGPGVVVAIDEHALVDHARHADVVLVTDVHVGAFVPKGAPLVEVHGADASRLDQSGVVRAFGLARERTMQRDVAFGFRQLADIAARALSPGVNDPTTAVQALDALHDLLRRLATRSLPTGAFSDEDGRLRLHLPAPRFGDYLQLGLDEAAQYGSESAQVRQRIEALLVDVRAAAREEHRLALDAWAAERSFPVRDGTPTARA